MTMNENKQVGLEGEVDLMKSAGHEDKNKKGCYTVSLEAFEVLPIAPMTEIPQLTDGGEMEE